MSTLRFIPSPLKAARRVYLATPVHDGKPFENHSASLPNAILALAAAGIAADQGIEAGNPHVDDARNILIRDFLARLAERGYTDLVFIDADVGFPPDALLRILEPDRDIVAGVYPKKQDEAEFPVVIAPAGTRLVTEEDGLLEVERVPSGFLRMRTHVLQRLAAMAVNVENPGAKLGEPLLPLIFQRTTEPPAPGRKAMIRPSGDYAFSRKARDAGYRIFVDAEIRFSHAGIKVYSGRLGDHLRAEAGIPHPAFLEAIEALKAATEAGEDPDPVIFTRLWHRWGNPYAAPPELLEACYHAALMANGPVLETGSGLTTLVMGIATAKKGNKVFALEHDPDWYTRTRSIFPVDGWGVCLIYAPLRGRDYDRWTWYDGRDLADHNVFGRRFSLVVCDGPQRRFGREGLFRVLGEEIAHGLWLMDDADPGELAMLQKHAASRKISIVQSRAIPGRAYAVAEKLPGAAARLFEPEESVA